MDEHLKWKPQTDNIKTKIFQIIAVLYKVKDFRNKRALYLLYNSLSVPYLTYCTEVWGSACKMYINSSFISQKRAIRVQVESLVKVDTESRLIPYSYN